MSKKTWIWIAAALVVVLIAVLWFVYRPSDLMLGRTAIRIGSVLPLTGSAGVWGQNAKMGMDLALEEIRTSGGIKGRELVVLYEDSQSDPKVATSALQKLITSDRVQVVIGDIASSSVLAMAPIAERNKIVLLSPGASNPDISNAGDFIFRNWQSDALEGQIDARYAFSTLKWKRVVCLYVNNAYGAGLSKVFTETFTALGGKIVAQESFSQGATDLRAQITRVGAAKPDGIFMPGYPPEMATALKQMRETGVRFPVLSVQAFDDPEIVNRAGQAAEGVIFSVPKPPDSNSPPVAKFRSQYLKKYGKEPGVTSDTGYDAVRIVAWALEQNASTGSEIRERLTKLQNFPGAAGPTTFDEHGDVVREFVFRTISQGKVVNAQR
jgi:branched-chain amino acid transport system substrate-binding protein